MRVRHSDEEVYDAVIRLGSQVAAGEHLEMSASHISTRMARYERVTGRRLPKPVKRVSPERMARRVSASSLDAALIAVVHALERVEAKLDQLIEAPPVSQWKPDHRRIVDGGTQVSTQRRQVRDRR